MATQPEFVEQLFEAALALKPEEREAFLEQGCGDDQELRHTVEALLLEDANAGSLLEHCCVCANLLLPRAKQF